MQTRDAAAIIVPMLLRLIPIVLSFATVVLAAEKDVPTLFVVGDSTVKNGTKGQVGWGDRLAPHFDPSKIKIDNRARGGRSSRTFQTEGLWDKVLADAKPGDFVLIQFGHNDGGPLDDAARARGSIRGTGDESRDIDNPITKKKDTVHTYGWYLRKYVADAKARGITPIVCSPVPRVPAKPLDAVPPDAGYVLWSAEVAKDRNVAFIPLNHLILTRYLNQPPAEIKQKYFVEVDNTHTSDAGATLNAQCVVDGIRHLQNCALADHLRPVPAAK